MASLLFKLASVPDDEADDIRDLLDDAELEFYETSSGIWGLSFAAIWLTDDSKLEDAKRLLNEYQQKRYQQVTQSRQERIDLGEQESHWQQLKSQPIRLVATIIFVAMVLYFSVAPFFIAI